MGYQSIFAPSVPNQPTTMPSGGYTSIFTPQTHITAAHNAVNSSLANEHQQLRKQFIPNPQKVAQTQKIAQQTDSQVAKNTTKGFSLKNLGQATRDVGVGVARFVPRSVAGLESTTQQAITGKPTARTPNRIGRYILGTEPVQSSQERGAGAAASHPGGFKIPIINKTLSPATTGATEAGLSFLQDVLGTKGGVKSLAKGAAKVTDLKATTNATKTTAKNVAAQNVLKNVSNESTLVVEATPKSPPPPPAESPEKISTPVETQIKPGQGSAKPTPVTSEVITKKPGAASNNVGELSKINAKTIESKAPIVKLGEEGSVAPTQVASDVKDFIKNTQAKVQKSNEVGDTAKSVGDKLFALKNNYTADLEQLIKFTKGTEKFNSKDLEAAYHYAEDKTSPITDTQKAIHDQYVKPLIDETNAAKAKLKSQGIELPSGDYIHRIAVDKGTGLERFMQGDTASPRTGSILRKTTPSGQRRVMYAATDEAGNRKVVAIKSPKNELGNVTGPKQITAFVNGKTQELGKVKLDSPLTGNLVGKSFKAEGKKYIVGDATTKEIEQHSNVKYYKNPIVNSALDYVNTRNAERADQFLNDWKTSPDFKNIAIKEGEGRVPEGWRATQAPQFRGYYFHPRVAEALDDFAPGRGADPLAALDGMNRFLRNAIFFNPLIHIPNVGTAWATSRGISGFVTPRGITSLVKDFPKAINEVVHEGPLYQKFLREGAPFMHFDQEQFADQITKMMGNQLNDPKISDPVAKALGYANPKALLKAFYGVSHKATWYSNDIFTMQRILEEVRKGKTDDEAVKEVGKYLPNYRLPSRLMGSRRLKQTISNPNITMFAPYHYGILKSYGNAIRSLAIGGAKEKPGAIDKLLIGGLIGLVGYPALDKLDKKITGNPNASQRRAGPFTLPNAVASVIQHKSNATTGSALQKIFTPSVLLSSADQLKNNKNFFGNQIYNKDDLTKNPRAAVKQLGNFGLGTVAPVAQGQKIATGKQSTKSFLGGLLGVSQPKSTPLGNKVSNLLSKQLGSSGMTIQEQQAAKQKSDARDQLASGKGDSQARALLASGAISKAGLNTLKSQAKWTSTQRAFDSLSPSNKLQILQSTPAAQRGQLFGDKQILLQGLANTANSKTAKPETVKAAKQIIKLLGGDQNDLLLKYKNQQKINRRLDKFKKP